MGQRALVVGGAGRVGRGVAQAAREAGFEVVVVDPAGGDVSAAAAPGLLDQVGRVDLAVLSLPARGQGREAGSFRPAAVAAEVLPARLAALELAVRAVRDGVLLELAGGAAVEPGPDDEAGLIGRWQRGVHLGLGQAGIRAILCAITGYVDPDADASRMGRRIVELAASGRSGVCRLASADAPEEWMD
jgi:hypothetical protein